MDARDPLEITPPNLPANVDKPPKIDQAKAKVVFGLLARNASRSVACAGAKFPYAEFKRAMARGERQKEGEYRDFYEAVLYYEAAAENILLGVLWQDAVENKNVSTAKYLLERRFRRRWAPKMDATRTMPALQSPAEVQELSVQLDVDERLARIEALKALAADRQSKRLAAAKPAEPLEVAVVEPPEAP